MLWVSKGFWDHPHSECPLEGRGPVSGEHGVLTWTYHCSDNLMPSSPRWGQVERGLPGEVHAVQLQQDLHGHGHAVGQSRWSVDTLPTPLSSGLNSFHVGAIFQYIPVSAQATSPALQRGTLRLATSLAELG